MQHPRTTIFPRITAPVLYGFVLLSLLLLPAGCIGPKNNALATLATDPAWQRTQTNTPLPAVAWVRGRADTVHIYIEGDGLAYTTRTRPSADPTPLTPTGLLLAKADSSPAVAYLARPCQYVHNNKCRVEDWTTGRFSETVIQTENRLVEKIKRLAGATHVVLYGYSGGGAVAALLAARRTDVPRLVTICGNLDHALWTKLHKVSPLTTSLNPIAVAGQLRGIRQVHFVGQNDHNIPPAIAASFINHLPPGTVATLRVITGLGHNGKNWAAFWQQAGSK